MKLMVASDIHGAAGYCEELLKRFGEEGADRLLLLGDILYHGPRNDLPDEYNPKKVIEMLNPLADKLMCVRGNCDTEVDQMVLNFPIMAEYAIIYVGNRMIYATHGHHINPSDTGNLKEGDILLSGHTHIPMCEEIDGILCLNPGSVSIPKENTKHSYMMIEDGCAQWKDLNGEVYKSKMIV